MSYQKIRIQIEATHSLFLEKSINKAEYLKLIYQLEQEIYTLDNRALQEDFKQLMIKYSL